jgi:hypothetical protein
VKVTIEDTCLRATHRQAEKKFSVSSKKHKRQEMKINETKKQTNR